MKSISFPPDWFQHTEDQLREKLPAKQFKKYKEFCDLYVTLNNLLDSVEETRTNIQLKHNKPSFFQIESWYLNFLYTFYYKLRNLRNSLNYSLEIGNFVSAVIIIRSVLETSCCHHYFLRRMENHAENFVKSQKHLGEGLGETMKLLARAVNGSNFPWEKHLGSQYKKNNAKYLNAQEAIRETGKKLKTPFCEHYNILSEMVHPNFGSNTLVIHTRERENDQAFEIVLGEGKHPDGLLWFFHNLAEPLKDTIELTVQCANRSHHLSIYLQSLTSKFELKET
jgi:hypothetical protein